MFFLGKNRRAGVFCCVLWIFIMAPAESGFGQSRSFNDVFPELDEAKKQIVLSGDGFVAAGKGIPLQRIVPAGYELAVQQAILKNAYITESVAFIPSKKTTILTIYNAIQNVRDLKGMLYHSATKAADVPLFEDATRIKSDKDTSALPDPPQAAVAPSAETWYVRLKDANFGNSYYRVDIAANSRAIVCTLTNFRDLSFLFVPVIKKENFIAQIYLEPVVNGLVIYSVASADVSDFFASKIHVPSAVQKRLEVIKRWVIGGLGAE
ncbi:MAG: hypothetical protein LBF60_03770 [Treponema sp.]|jgi:hypothetical protein|nr:hypothetical protein [Treponema sp.]